MPQELKSWLSPSELESFEPYQRLARIVVRAFRVSPGMAWHRPFIRHLKLCGAFPLVLQHARKMAAFNQRVLAMRPDLALDRIKLDRVIDWFHQKWGASTRFDLCLQDRGFADVSEFAATARNCYLYSKNRADPLNVSLDLYTIMTQMSDGKW